LNTLIQKFIVFLIIIYGFLFFGYALRKIFPRLGAYSRKLSNIFLIFLSPIIILNSFWSIDIQNTRFAFATLPFILTGIQALSFLPAFFLSMLLKLNRREKGSFISSSMFSNNGITLGIFLCFLLFGDEGLYLASWFIALFTPVFYLAGFPLISLFSEEKKMNAAGAFLELVKNPVSIVPILSMCTGMALNLAAVPRPPVMNFIVTRYLTYLSVAGFSFAMGLGLSFSKSIKYVKHALCIALIKFIYNPLIGILLLAVFGYLKMDNPLPSSVVFIQSFMPTAIMAVILSKVFRLNEDLSNAAWIITNLLVIPMIPVMIFLPGFF